MTRQDSSAQGQNTLRLHEMTEEQDPEEAGLMKQRSRIEQAQKLKAQQTATKPQ